MAFHFTPIGLIHSPYVSREGMPIQPTGARGVAGTVDLDPALAAGLADLDGFSHLFLIYAFHQSEGYALTVTPFLDTTPRGLFATRAPRRPNPLGLSVVRLDRVEGARLHILDVDVLDGTPLLDIKPYVPEFDAAPEAASGWLACKGGQAQACRSDDRFVDQPGLCTPLTSTDR